MSYFLKIKLLAYRFFTSPFGKSILKNMSFAVTAPFLRKNTQKKKYPFHVVITIDTESGYVDKNQRRVWQGENPRNYQGYYFGIYNLRNVFRKYKIAATFFLSTNCFSAVAPEYKKIRHELNALQKDGHELGLHFHPDSDLVLQKRLNKKFPATSAFYYSHEEKKEVLSAAKELIKEHLGKSVHENLKSFRWGNWALDGPGAKALHELGFQIDSSATPGIQGHLGDPREYHWEKARQQEPWYIDFKDHQNTQRTKKGLLEIPIATFTFFGTPMRADPLNSILLKHAFDYYYRNADRSQKPFIFVIITHSAEATTRDGSPTRTLADLEEFIIHSKKKADVKFMTIKQAAAELKKQ